LDCQNSCDYIPSERLWPTCGVLPFFFGGRSVRSLRWQCLGLLIALSATSRALATIPQPDSGSRWSVLRNARRWLGSVRRALRRGSLRAPADSFEPSTVSGDARGDTGAAGHGLSTAGHRQLAQPVAESGDSALEPSGSTRTVHGTSRPVLLVYRGPFYDAWQS